MGTAACAAAAAGDIIGLAIVEATGAAAPGAAKLGISGIAAVA
jgi:hypothetical protein